MHLVHFQLAMHVLLSYVAVPLRSLYMFVLGDNYLTETLWLINKKYVADMSSVPHIVLHYLMWHYNY